MKRIVVFVLIVSFIFSGCGSYSIVSQKFDVPITVDGNLNDWNGKLKYLKDEKIALGVSNDDENLYICLSTAAQSNIIKMLRMGFTIWVEPGNEKGETIGIQYPIREEMKEPHRVAESERNSFGRHRFEKMIDNIKMNKNEYLLINDDNFPLGAYSLTDKSNVKIGLGYEAGKLVYEIKIPRKSTSYFPINLSSLNNNAITLKFSSNKPDQPFPNKVTSVPVRRGMGDRTGGMRRGGNRVSRERGFRGSDFTNPINFEIKVILTE